MGREMRRREERKNKKILENKQEVLDTTVSKITVIKLVGAIVLILLVLYYVLAVFVTKELDVSGGRGNNSSEVNSVSNGVANKILASGIFNQSEESYYVYFYDFNDEDESISSAIGRKSDWKIYRVDTSNSLNSKYVTEDAGNANVTGLDDLKVKNPTLIQVSADKVIAYYEGSTNILNFLG